MMGLAAGLGGWAHTATTRGLEEALLGVAFEQRWSAADVAARNAEWKAKRVAVVSEPSEDDEGSDSEEESEVGSEHSECSESTGGSDSQRVCVRCNEEFRGFGDTCSACRRSHAGSFVSCHCCGGYFRGFGRKCWECIEGKDSKAAFTGKDRRSSRTVRTLDEKSNQWKHILSPCFQNLATSAMLTGEPQAVPDHLRRASQDGVFSPELLLDTPKIVSEHRGRHSKYFRCRSEKHSRSESDPSSQSVALRGKDGDHETFVSWQDHRGVTGNIVQHEAASEAERVALLDAAKKRSAEQCMSLYVTSFAERQKLRMAVEPEQVVGARPRVGTRQAVAEEANRFQGPYACVQGLLSGRLSFRRPTRSHTVAFGDIARAIVESECVPER